MAQPHQISDHPATGHPLGTTPGAEYATTVPISTPATTPTASAWESALDPWYLDGKVIHTYTGPNVPAGPCTLLANLAIDGPAKSGSTLSIKSVKIYRTG